MRRLLTAVMLLGAAGWTQTGWAQAGRAQAGGAQAGGAQAHPTKEAVGIPQHGKPVVLFSGRTLMAFDNYIKADASSTELLNAGGLNNGANDVFMLEEGAIHVSGQHFGYLITKQAYVHYYLRAQFKWGEGTYAPRAGKARDSGILFNIQGEQKVWPRSLEFQICEGGTGDFWMTDGAAITGKDGVRVTGPEGKAKKIARFGEGPWTNVVGFRDAVGEVEKPHGEWNQLEMVNDGDHVTLYVNGKLVNEGTAAFPDSGKILFQSEGAEVWFRDIVLYPLKKKHG